MGARMYARPKPIGDGVVVELVRSLYKTLIPTLIMSVGYVASFAVMAFESANAALAIFAFAGVLSGGARILVVLQGTREARKPDLTVDCARKLEKRFAIAYFQFAALLSVSAAYVFFLGSPRFHMLVVCLLIGYGAGVAAGIGLRPWIAIPSMLVAIVPSVMIASWRWDPVYWTMGVMTSALLVGGCGSLLVRFRITSSEIGNRLTFANLARRDVLTMLPNRLALREWFEKRVAVGIGQDLLLAVHCLDLDDFKPVNDVYGHPVGDALLKAVAGRLARHLRASDIAARLGGDEFCSCSMQYLQCR
jgi:predicted signal transduction protein with EAL and GGDEF domain